MANFRELLERRPDEAAPPTAMPTGTYTVMIVNHEFLESAKKKTPFVRFNVRPVQPHDDVDLEVLNSIENWREKTLRDDFYITPDSEYRLADFLRDTLGINTDGRSYGQTIPESRNLQYVVTIVHEMPERREGDTRDPQPRAVISARARVE